MKQTTIDGYTNSKPIYNTTGFIAQAIARKIGRWSVHNILMGFKPPKVGAITIVSPNLPPPEEPLEPEMFYPGALLHDRPLNFYIAIQALPEPFLINAGYLMAYFVLGNRTFYKELKKLLSAEIPATGAPEEAQ